MLPNFIFDAEDIIYVFGQDGLVANTIKDLDAQPVVGINPDKRHYTGILLPFEMGELTDIEPEELVNISRKKNIALGKVTLTDGQKLYAVNDFYIGQKSHVSSRYEILYRNQREHQSSSGIIISTGVGSTGWLKSVVSGETRISDFVLSNMKTGTEVINDLSFDWSEKKLIFSVRELQLKYFMFS